MSDPYGTPPGPGSNEPQPPAPQYGAPQHGAPQYGAPQYGAPQPPYGQPGPPAYGQYAGGVPPAPPAGPYGDVVPQLRVGDALRFAWAKFTGNAVAWVVFALVVAVVYGLLIGSLAGEYADWFGHLMDLASAGTLDAADMPQPGFSAGAIVLALVGAVIVWIAQVMAWNAALTEADGVRPPLGGFLRVRRMGTGLLAVVVVSVIGGLAGFIPLGPLVWGILVVFAVPFAVDHGRSAFGAIGGSFQVVGRNFGPVFLLLLTLVGINILGALVVLVGLLVTVPLSVLALAYAFRRLTGGTIV